MILARNRILLLVETKNLIEPFSEECLEGAGYDLRAEKFYRILSQSHIGVSGRKTPEIKQIESTTYTLLPGEYILVETLEKVNMPLEVAARILPRSSIFRCGCTLITALVDPGFKGTLTMGLKNLSDKKFTLEKGARIAQIVFEQVEGETKEYAGKYQGGKVV